MSEIIQDNSPDATGEAIYWSGDTIPSKMPTDPVYDAGAACFRALHRLLRECEWHGGWGTMVPGNYAVTPRNRQDSPIGAILAEAESAHSAWVRAHGE